jgi:hypothetical protein
MARRKSKRPERIAPAVQPGSTTSKLIREESLLGGQLVNKRAIYLVIALIGVIGLAAGWYLASPLIIDRTVDEELPFEVPSAEELAQMSEAQRSEIEEELLAAADTMPDKMMDDAMPDGEEIVILKEAMFEDADRAHKGSGTAKILQTPAGERLLRFEEFSVANGPDLHVILSDNPFPTSRDDVGTYVDLGELKGNIGNQNYEIPNDLNLDQYKSVVIYCMPFHVVFSIGTLAGG